jgi:hypothetical protein
MRDAVGSDRLGCVAEGGAEPVWPPLSLSPGGVREARVIVPDELEAAEGGELDEEVGVKAKELLDDIVVAAGCRHSPSTTTASSSPSRYQPPAKLPAS